VCMSRRVGDLDPPHRATRGQFFSLDEPASSSSSDGVATFLLASCGAMPRSVTLAVPASVIVLTARAGF
jgi:hypothetical protein